MKTGLIAPIPHLAEFGKGDFHLILAHLCTNQKYFDHYREQARLGSFIVLDNSAHEHGKGGDSQTLLDLSWAMGVHELVCPDVLFKNEETVQSTTSALRLYRSHNPNNLPRFMMVPQAESIYDWGQCLKKLVTIHSQLFPEKPFTIGISKDYEMWWGGLINLIDRFVVPLHHEFGKMMDVHLLGWGRKIHTLATLSIRYPWIRSTDSAKPFVYARGGIALEVNGPCPQYPTRPADYFTARLDGHQLVLARQNIKVFQTYAGAFDGQNTRKG